MSPGPEAVVTGPEAVVTGPEVVAGWVAQAPERGRTGGCGRVSVGRG
ncbi:hypothetical protein [Brevibacterium otitidis]|uniref:Uncharacterized protein n=1 Tax=Brevibacterium otitidis TaxID=53364 RepID=A0ABV5X035_9MICO